MKVTANFDTLEEWKEFCTENNLNVKDLGEDGWVCFNNGGDEFNPLGWFNEDLQEGEIDWGGSTR